MALYISSTSYVGSSSHLRKRWTWTRLGAGPFAKSSHSLLSNQIHNRRVENRHLCIRNDSYFLFFLTIFGVFYHVIPSVRGGFTDVWCWWFLNKDVSKNASSYVFCLNLRLGYKHRYRRFLQL